MLLALLGAQAAFAAPGDLDPSFAGGKGVLVPDFGAQEFGNALAIQPDGKILVAGNASTPTDPSDVLVARFSTQGSLDTSFASGAGYSRPSIADQQYAYGLALQPDGKIVLGGSTGVSSASNYLAVRLLNPQGTLDTSFGQGGAAPVDYGSAEFGNAVALQPDGKILLAGTFTEPGGLTDPAVIRILSPSGIVDAAGFDGGISIPDLPASASAQAMVLQPDGKILVAGATSG